MSNFQDRMKKINQKSVKELIDEVPENTLDNIVPVEKENSSISIETKIAKEKIIKKEVKEEPIKKESTKPKSEENKDNVIKTIAALLTPENNRFFRIQAKKNGLTMDSYIVKLVQEEQKRLEDLSSNKQKESRGLEIYEICKNQFKHSNKERTTIKIPNEIHSFILDEANNAGIAITNYLNYLIKKEEERISF